MLSWEYPPNIIGGISRHVEELAAALVKRDVEVHVITSWIDGTLQEEEINGVFIHRVQVEGDRSDFFPWVRSLNYRTEEKVDELLAKGSKKGVLLHAHDWLAEFAGCSLKQKHKLPLVATVHATEHGRNYGIYNDTQRYISQIEWELTYEAWRVIVCSEFMKDEVHSVLSVPMDKMDVIPNGIDADKFDFSFSDKKEFRNAYAAPDEKIIIHVGRNVREKGGSTLIAAFKRLLHEYPKAKLLIVGGGDRTWLKEQVSNLGISDRVYFTGFVDDETLLKLYRVSDVAVFPSYYEPFGIVALEGMAAKVPVVTSDVCGLTEVVTHNVTGITTYVENDESLAWGIAEVFKKSPLELRKMINAAYEKATTEFSWSRIAEQTEQVYKRVLEEHKKSDWK